MDYDDPIGITMTIIGDAQISIKTTDTSRNTTTTLVDDPDLHVILQQNTDYIITMCLMLEQNGGGFRVDSNQSSGTWSVMDFDDQACAYDPISSTFTSIEGGPTGGVGTLTYFRGRYETSGGLQDLRLTWAQDSSHANDSTVMAGSWMRAVQVSVTV